jgi:hypothetical protein
MNNITALNTLEWEYDDWLRESSCSQDLLEDIDERIIEVKIEMRRSVKQEPVAYIKDRELGYMLAVREVGAKEWRTNLGLYLEKGDVPLYTAPPKREWVGLTDDEINNLNLPESGTATVRDLVKLIEGKLKEKNA